VTQRKLDVIDLGEPEPAAYLPLDAARHTIALLEHHFAPQVRAQGYDAPTAQHMAHYAAMWMYAEGWRSSESILHKADNPIPAPRPPHLPRPLRLAA